MKQKILVTGASGFIGSFIVEEALRQGFEVWAGMRPTSRKTYLQDGNIRFICLTFADREKLQAELAAFRQEQGAWDYIVHCAGATKCKDKQDFELHNTLATRHFVEALEALGMFPRRFVFLSSLSVYGPIHERDDQAISGADIPKPDTAYGKSKLEAERFIQGHDTLPYVILRPTGVYGPRERDYFLMAQSIRQHVDFAAGFRKQALTFVYVKDLVQAVFLALQKGRARASYFVSDGQTYSSRTFSEYIQKELGIHGVLKFTCPLFLLKAICLACGKIAAWAGKSSTLNADKYRIMRQRNWRCDISPLVDDLGYKPQYLLERGVKETIQWYKAEGWL